MKEVRTAVATALLLGLLSWLFGLLTVPNTVERVESDMKTVQSDVKALMEAKGNLETSAENAADAPKELQNNVKGFTGRLDTQIRALELGSARLETTVNALAAMPARLDEVRREVSAIRGIVERIEKGKD